jgi:hypothetical protein
MSTMVAIPLNAYSVECEIATAMSRLSDSNVALHFSLPDCSHLPPHIRCIVSLAVTGRA